MLIPNKFLRSLELLKQNNTYNLKVGYNRIHSNHLEQEIARILNQISDNENLLLIGAGNGKIIQEIQKRKNLKLILFEPIKNFEYFQRFLYTNHLDYIHDYKQLSSLMSLYIYIYPVYKRLFPQLIDRILSFLENDINKKTFYKFLYTWIINYKKNLENDLIYFIHKLNIKKNKILFCGSGITLIEDLNKYDLNEYYIIASDSSVIPLLKKNISIDLIISIDPSIGTLYHFYNYKNSLKNIPLLTWLGGRAELKNIFSQRYFFLTSFPIDQYILQLNNNFLYLNASANDVLEYIIQITQLHQKPLYLAGCGLKNNTKFYYTTNTGYDYYALIKNHRIFSNEHYHYILYNNQAYKRKNFNFKTTTQIKTSEINDKEIIAVKSKFLKEYLIKNRTNIIKNHNIINLLFDIM